MIQIDMEIPENCSECRFSAESGYCEAMPDDFCGYTDDFKRPVWCPLKEQEPVPAIQREVMNLLVWCCGSCGVVITHGDKFCRMCGREVKWG